MKKKMEGKERQMFEENVIKEIKWNEREEG